MAAIRIIKLYNLLTCRDEAAVSTYIMMYVVRRLCWLIVLEMLQLSYTWDTTQCWLLEWSTINLDGVKWRRRNLEWLNVLDIWKAWGHAEAVVVRCTMIDWSAGVVNQLWLGIQQSWLFKSTLDGIKWRRRCNLGLLEVLEIWKAWPPMLGGHGYDKPESSNTFSSPQSEGS